jgi:signal transduction histidine kinase
MSSEIESLRLELAQSRAELAALKNAGHSGRSNGAVSEEIADQGRSEALLEREKHLLEMIAADRPLSAIFEALCHNVEEVFVGAFSIVMTYDAKTNRLLAGAAPRIPAFLAEVNGFEVTEAVGTCAAAAFLKQQVITTDITVDPYWANYRDLAQRHGLRSGWATPIRSNLAQVLGVFSLYWPEPQKPTARHLEIIDKFVRLVALAMERRQAVDALAASERLARGQTEALTHALDALAKESDPNQIMEHVLRTVTSQLDAHSCSIWLRNPSSNLMAMEFSLENNIFKTRAALGSASPLLPLEDFPTWVEMYRVKKSIVLEDIRGGCDFPCRDSLVAKGVITLLAVPMVIAGEVGGLIAIRFRRKRVFADDERELAQAFANQAMLAIQLSRLSDRERQAAVTSERSRIARDIHDTLAHNFTGVIVHAEAASEAISRNRWDIASTHLRGAGDIARDGLRESRRSVQALRQERLEGKSLSQALGELIARLTEGTDIQTTFNVNGSAQDLSAGAEDNVLRIGQEVLTNSVRHAQATLFEATLTFSEGLLSLEMRDNGCGFVIGQQYEGFGLRGMWERARDIGAELKVDSIVGVGTRVTVLLPLESQESGFANHVNGSEG